MERRRRGEGVQSLFRASFCALLTFSEPSSSCSSGRLPMLLGSEMVALATAVDGTREAEEAAEADVAF